MMIKDEVLVRFLAELISQREDFKDGMIDLVYKSRNVNHNNNQKSLYVKNANITAAANAI